ncbi:hypothetical protein OROGR_020110 [Orobanche gracilis]
MDQLNRDSLLQSLPSSSNFQNSSELRVLATRPNPDCSNFKCNKKFFEFMKDSARMMKQFHIYLYHLGIEAEANVSITARKVQKADREKLRRDRLNEQFTELGNTLAVETVEIYTNMLPSFADPDRPRNDKASILADTIQMLKDLTAQVDKLKSEYASLTEESRELTQEKNDLREEKASLKSDIENLNTQYLQRMRAMYPWAGMDHSVVMHPSSYAFPMPVPMPAGPIPMHPSLQPYPFYGNQNPAVVPNPCPNYVPYTTHNTVTEPMHHVSQAMPRSNNRSHGSGRQDRRCKTSDGENIVEKSDYSNDITTELELKTPGSTPEQNQTRSVDLTTDFKSFPTNPPQIPQSKHNPSEKKKDPSSKQRKARKIARKETTEASSSTGCSSVQSVQAISSDSIVGCKKDE